MGRYHDPEKLNDILEGTQFRGTSISPNGKYVLVKYYTRMEGGKSEQYAQLRDAATGIFRPLFSTFHLIFGFNECHSEIGGKTPIAITSSRNAQRCL